MRQPLRHIISALFLIISTHHDIAAAATYLPPPSPIQCNSSAGCTVDNYQGMWLDRKPCKASKALYPTSEAELIDAVALASKTGSKIKFVSKGSHSLPKLVCPGGDEGLLISTQHYNSYIHVNLTSRRVSAHAGVQLRALLDKIAEYGLAFPHTPVWQSLSVAGMISTGAHGSGMWGKGSHPHDYVVGMRLIVPASEEEGYAKVLELCEGDEDLDAARLSLGVLGAISMVTFQLEPMFKRSVRLEIRGDERLHDEVLQFAAEHEFGEISWYPASGNALFRVDDRVGVETEGDGSYHIATFEKLDVDYIESLRSGLEAAEKSQSLGELCQEEVSVMNFRQSSGDGLTNFGNTFKGYPVVGHNNKMQTSGGCEEEEEAIAPIITPTGIEFNPTHEDDTQYREDIPLLKQAIPLIQNNKLETCTWNPLINGFFFFDTSISIPSSKVGEAVIEIKKLRDLNPMPMCSFASSGGIWIRFLTASTAYLGQPTNSVVFEMMYFRAKDPFTPRLHQDLFEEIEQMLLNKFGGKPHWGKNRDLTFENMHTRTRAMAKFLEVRQRFDPMSLFSNEWTDAILGIQSSRQGMQTFQDHCALEGFCVCKEDSHCHPTKGYFCRPGHVYNEARVCRYEKQDPSI